MEKDVRIDVLNSILKTPHKDVANLINIHNECASVDPLFYTKLGIWYRNNGSVRDHSKLFAAGIITSSFPELRFVGEKLLEEFSPKDLNETINIAYDNFNACKGSKRRRIRRAVSVYLNDFEKQSNRDNGYRLLTNSKFIRSLYLSQQLACKGKTAASLRFRTNKPAYQAFIDVRTLSKLSDELEICELLAKRTIPFLQAVGSIKEITPAIAVALLDCMTANQVINNMSIFERKGLLDIAEFKQALDKKLKKGSKKKGASLRSKVAAKKVSKASDILSSHSDSFVESLDKIDKKVLLAIDKSHSMKRAIEVGKDVSAILASKVRNPNENLKVVTFNNTVQVINLREGMTYTDFDTHFRYITANGSTAIGGPVVACSKLDFVPDVFIFITDCDEVSPPFLDASIKNSDFVVGSKFIFCLVGERTYEPNISKQTLIDCQIEVESIKFDGDYYSLPNLIKVIASGGIKEVIESIDTIDPFTYFAKVA